MKNTGKRLLSLLAALSLATGLCLTGAGAAVYAANTEEANVWTSPFTDVGPDNWFYEAVAYVCQQGMMNGVSSDKFEPNAVTNRAMIVTILWRMAGEPEAAAQISFTDVAEDRYYADAVTWAGSYNIVTGYDDGTFRPNDPITREQLAVILYRYALSKGYDTTVFSSRALEDFADGGAVATYARAAMSWAVSIGLVTGVDASTLNPDGTATRAASAAMLMRFCEKVHF